MLLLVETSILYYISELFQAHKRRLTWLDLLFRVVFVHPFKDFPVILKAVVTLLVPVALLTPFNRRFNKYLITDINSHFCSSKVVIVFSRCSSHSILTASNQFDVVL